MKGFISILKFWIKNKTKSMLKCFLYETMSSISRLCEVFLHGRKICSVDCSVLAVPHVFWEKERGGRREELKESLFKPEPV